MMTLAKHAHLRKALHSSSNFVLNKYIQYHLDFRRISTDAAKEWLKFLKKEEVPVIVCLTHADRFYAECIEESEDKNPKPSNDKKRKIGMELLVMTITIK